MNNRATTHMQWLAAYLRENQHRLTIDADTHATDLTQCRRREVDHYYHGRPLSAEELMAEMDLAQVSMANTWQNPASTVYPGGEDENAASLLAANRYIFESALRLPERFIPSGWVDPKACGVRNACRLAKLCVEEFGFAIVKMNPAQNSFPIDSPDVLRVVDCIVELGAAPAFHYGADSPYTPASGLEAIALRYPDHPVVAVHMGGGGAGYVEAEPLYHQSRELGLRRPNLKFILSALRDTHIEEALICYQMAGAPYAENLFCASDAPYGRIAWNFGGFRAVFRGLLEGARHPDTRVRSLPDLFTPEAVQGYLGANFARFVAALLEQLLARRQAPSA